MPDTEVILIRHGETEWNVAKRFQGHKDSDLTENGKQQVEALGTYFQDEDLDQLYSSDLLRTQKTRSDKLLQERRSGVGKVLI